VSGPLRLAGRAQRPGLPRDRPEHFCL